MALISKIKGTNNTEYNVRDDVSVWGGRNLIKNSNFNNNMFYWNENKYSNDNTTIEIIKENNKNWLHVISNNASQSQQYYDGVNQIINLNNNNPVTISFLAKGSVNNTPLYIGFAIYNVDDDNVIVIDKTINLTTTVSKYWFTQSSLSNYSSINLFIGSNSTPIEVWITNIKLEQGTKPTDWSPAPEDIAHVNGECLELLS